MVRAGLPVLLLLALTAHAVLQPAAPDGSGGPAPADGDDAAVDRALRYLADQRATPEAIEAFLAAGRDPAPLVADLRVPRPTPDDPNAPLRELHALLRAGVGVHDDPERGPLDLADELRAAHAHVDGSGAGSTLGFWLLSAHALGWNGTEPLVAESLDQLVAAQRPDGAFPCLAEYASLECTAYAVTALAAHDALGRIDRDAAHGNVRTHGLGGAYTDGFTGKNSQSTAWAVTALRHLGDDAAADEALDWLRGLQLVDGSYARAPGQPGPARWWTTAEVVVALRGGHPVAAPVTVPVPAPGLPADGA